MEGINKRTKAERKIPRIKVEFIMNPKANELILFPLYNSNL